MKKVLVVLLALLVLLSLSGVALADRIPFMWPSGATVMSNIDKDIDQKTEARAWTGGSYADANRATNMVTARSDATALDSTADASNTSAVGVANIGDALSSSGPAANSNDVSNAETDVITDIASATVDCDFTMLTCNVCGCPLATTSNGAENNTHEHGCDACECCPATVMGDINIEVDQKTEAEATSGDATSYGNNATNIIGTCDQALANDGGTAANSSTVTVLNDGVATSMSGAASSSNIADNSVWIDIYRSAVTSRTVSRFLQY